MIYVVSEFRLIKKLTAEPSGLCCPFGFVTNKNKFYAKKVEVD